MIYLKRISIFILSIAVLLVLTQDLQIFPGMFRSIPANVPREVTQIFTQTEDGKKIEILKYEGIKGGPLFGKAVILSHGNFETNYSSIPVLEWLGGLGMDAYVYDYRGYGNSQGWPSEEGIYADSWSTWKKLNEEYGLKPENTLILGISIGTGIASQLAAKISPKCLTLLSPYESLGRVVKQNIIFRPLVPFLKYDFPTGEFLGRLSTTKLLLVHGKVDNVIDYQNSLDLYEAVKGSLSVEFLTSEKASHNDLLYYFMPDISEGIVHCMK